MKTNQTTTQAKWAKLPAPRTSRRATISSYVSLLGCAALLLAAAGSALAQTTNIVNVVTTNAPAAATVNSVILTSYTANRARLTVPVSQTNTVATSVRVSLAGAQTIISSTTNDLGGGNLEITNTIDYAPKYAALSPANVPSGGGGASVALGVTSITNEANGNANFDVAVTLNYTNLPSGYYDDMAIVTTGANVWSYPLPVIAGFVWSAGGGANTNFNNTANWIGGAVPGAGDVVILDNAGTVASATQPTIAITSDTAIGSVSDIHTNVNYVHWNIASGATLLVTNTGGFRQLMDWVEANANSRIRASGAGTLVISNANAKMIMVSTRNSTKHDPADFSGLSNLVVDVSQISFNDIGTYPLYGTNGILNRPSGNVYDMDWARTNILRATFANPGGYTGDISRNYSMAINRQVGATTSDGGMHFGAWNELYMDSILFGGASQMVDTDSRVDFRAAGSYIKFRAPDKTSRMPNITIADAYITNLTSGNAVNVDVRFDVFAGGTTASGGTVDALVDTLIVGRDPFNTANGRASGRLYLGGSTPGACVFDVNTALLGYQTGPGTGTEEGHARGEVNVNSNGVFRVNNTMVLGHTVVTSNTVVTGYGMLNVNAGGIAYINAVTAGGPAGATLGNTSQRIALSGGGVLVLSNSVCTPSARLNTFSMNNSKLTLPSLSLNNTSVPNIYCTTLTTTGTSNLIEIVTLTSNSLPSYPVRIPVVSYTGSAAPNFSVSVPAGYYAFPINNTASNTVDVVVSITPPQALVWDGDASGSWDGSSGNWKSGLLFGDGDGVTFDDTAAGPNYDVTAVEVVVGNAGVLFTNDTQSYSLAGGPIYGTSTMRKQGTNSLTVSAVSTLPITLNQGSLTVASGGNVGITTAAAGTTVAVNNSATVLRLNNAGTAANAGIINGLSVTAGVLNNTGTINGAYDIGINSTVTNQPGSFVNTVGVSTLATNSTLVHNGEMNLGNANVNSRFSVAGILTGSGSIFDFTGDLTGNNGRLEINPSGVFTPGGANTIGTFEVGARFDLNTGTPDGRLIIDVDTTNPATNDVLVVAKWSNFRGALVMNNLGPAFTAGQSFLIYNKEGGFPNTPEAAFDLTNKITPRVPGVGLQWDVSNLKSNGIIAVVTAPATPPQLLSSNIGGTNLTFSWPLSHLGYQLQVQTNALAVGLYTNWSGLSGTEYVTATNISINPSNPAVFFRLSNK
jgi:hypothetical protein